MNSCSRHYRVKDTYAFTRFPSCTLNLPTEAHSTGSVFAKVRHVPAADPPRPIRIALQFGF